MAFKEVKQDRAKETRDRILVGAAQTFALYGYAGASIANILEASSTTKGALYFHFTQKNEVAEAVLAADFQRVREMRAAANPNDDLNGLTQMLYLSAHRRLHDPLALAADRLFLEGSLFRTQQLELYGYWVTMIENSLNNTAKMGWIRDELELEGTARVLGAAFIGAHQSAEVWGDPQDAVKLVRQWVALLAPGLVKPEAFDHLVLDPKEELLEMDFVEGFPELGASSDAAPTQTPNPETSRPMLGRPGLPPTFAAS